MRPLRSGPSVILTPLSLVPLSRDPLSCPKPSEAEATAVRERGPTVACVWAAGRLDFLRSSAVALVTLGRSCSSTSAKPSAATISTTVSKPRYVRFPSWSCAPGSQHPASWPHPAFGPTAVLTSLDSPTKQDGGGTATPLAGMARRTDPTQLTALGHGEPGQLLRRRGRADQHRHRQLRPERRQR